MFKHDMIDLPVLERIDSSTGPRLYKTPSGKKYASVTSMLGATADKSFLYEWRKRVGEEQANIISTRAARRGTSVHDVCEKFLLNEQLPKMMPVVSSMFARARPILEKSITCVRATEATLFSHQLKLAGSVDLICDFNEQLSVVDFKTSLKPKKIEWIEDYFLQASAYSCMLYEMTGLLAKNLVIIIFIENTYEIQVFEQPISLYMQKLIERNKKYQEISLQQN